MCGNKVSPPHKLIQKIIDSNAVSLKNVSQKGKTLECPAYRS